MADQQRQGSAIPALLREMNLTEQDIERRKRFVSLGREDLERIASIKDLVVQNAEELTASFFTFLAGIDEAQTLLSNREVVEHARRLKREHLVAMVQGDYGIPYVEQRLELGLVYSRARFDVRVFLGAFHHLLRQIGALIFKQFERSPIDGFEAFMSLKKVAFFDIALIVDVLVSERQRVIRHQQEAIRELSTPVLQIRERLLLLPVIGVIDTQRARFLTEGLLKAIRANRAKVVVMDVTGVATIDSKVANHILQSVAAAKLMGATVIVTGLSSEVAQSLVALGIGLGTLNTVGDLQGGMEEAERLLGYRVVVTDERAPSGQAS